MPTAKQLKNFNIFEVMIATIITTGKTYFTTAQAKKVINRIVDQYPFVQFISRLGRGIKWPIESPIAFGRMVHDTYINGFPEPFIATVVNPETYDVTIAIAPIQYTKVLKMYKDKSLAYIPQLSGIFYVPKNVIEIARQTIDENSVI